MAEAIRTAGDAILAFPTSSLPDWLLTPDPIPTSPYQQHLNLARQTFLHSSNLGVDHAFRKRVNEFDGTLLSSQPKGRPRTASTTKPLSKKPRKDKECAAYFLERHRLVTMWNGAWVRDEDWIAWDRARPTMELKFSEYRLVAKPALRDWINNGMNTTIINGPRPSSSRKRRRASSPEPEEQQQELQSRPRSNKKHRASPSIKPLAQMHKTFNAIPTPPEVRTQAQTPHSPIPGIDFPTHAAIRAMISPTGTSTQQVLFHFWGCKGYDTERFSVALDAVSIMDVQTRMLYPREDRGRGQEKQQEGDDCTSGTTTKIEEKGRMVAMVIDPVLLSIEDNGPGEPAGEVRAGHGQLVREGTGIEVY